MAKKKIDIGNRTRGKNLSSMAENIDASDETKEVIEKVSSSPTKENIIEAEKIIESDVNISTEDKTELIEILKRDFTEVFNFKNCPNEYEKLKNEAKFLSRIAKYSFLIMAQRLKKIRDCELYRQDGYVHFQDFIEAEIKLSKSTVYYYIDIITQVPPGRLENRDIEYTKLKPILPLLKSNSEDIPKEEIQEKFLNDIQHKSRKEIEADAKELKIKYGLLKDDSETDEEYEIKVSKNKITININTDFDYNGFKKELEYLIENYIK